MPTGTTSAGWRPSHALTIRSLSKATSPEYPASNHLSHKYDSSCWLGRKPRQSDRSAMEVTAVRAGGTVAQIRRRTLLRGIWRDKQAAVLPSLSIRETLVKRVHHQRTAYWKPGGEGVEHFAPAEW